jgi:hypothetical protein
VLNSAAYWTNSIFVPSQLTSKRAAVRSELHVEIEPLVSRDDAIVVSVQISGHPRARKRNGQVWIEVPADMYSWQAVQDKPDDLHDAFARMFLVSAMEADCDLVIHGNVSTSLLANLERWQDIVSRWWPSYRRVHLSADREVSSPAEAAANANLKAAKTIQAFSGGLDSIETLYGHHLDCRGRNTRNISTCLFIHGFDVDWRDERFATACDRARQLCKTWGVHLKSVRTNIKEMLPNWRISHAPVITGVLSLFQREFATGLLASTRAYESLEFVISENASTAMTDPLLSSASFQVIHDLASTRTEKTLLLKDRPEVWPLVRVCWEGKNPTANCGQCEKCIRQMLCMLAAGVDDFRGFQFHLTPEAVSRVQPHEGFLEDEWRACYALVEQQGREQLPEFQAMRHVLDQCAAERDAHSANSGRSHSIPPPKFARGWLQRIRGVK